MLVLISVPLSANVLSDSVKFMSYFYIELLSKGWNCKGQMFSKIIMILFKTFL